VAGTPVQVTRNHLFLPSLQYLPVTKIKTVYWCPSITLRIEFTVFPIRKKISSATFSFLLISILKATSQRKYIAKTGSLSQAAKFLPALDSAAPVSSRPLTQLATRCPAREKLSACNLRSEYIRFAITCLCRPPCGERSIVLITIQGRRAKYL